MEQKKKYHAFSGRMSSLRDHVMNGGSLFSIFFSYFVSKCVRRDDSRCSMEIMLGDECCVQGRHFGRKYLKKHFFVITFPLTDNFAPYCCIITV